ncbi:MAG: response regulator [Nitrospinota bacterium]|nr:response regulator [Nitrospinota bacterium]
MKVLVIEDEPIICDLIRTLLEIEGFEVDISTNGEDGLQKAKTSDYSLIISDIVLPGINGLQILKTLKGGFSEVPVIVISGHKDFDYAVEALNLGAVAFIVKPFNNTEFLEQVKNIQILTTSRKIQDFALKYRIAERHELLLDTKTFTQGDNLLSTANFLSKQFDMESVLGKVESIKYSLAIHEALRNAIEHGNLELSSDLKNNGDGDGFEKYEKLFRERVNDSKYGSREVFLEICRCAKQIDITIRDEGNGFNHKEKMAIVKSGKTNADDFFGRGLFIIASYMDKLEFNEKGNEIIMSKILK